MAEVFADTAGWGNLFVGTEPYHIQTFRLVNRWRRRGVRIVTTNYILTELVALFHRPLRIPRPRAISYIDTIKSAPYVEIVHIDPTTDADSWALLKARQDKDWSLVDCSSFVIMQRRGITEALTTDRHFEQAGFMRLLTP
jgi:uncharacterized protein